MPKYVSVSVYRKSDNGIHSYFDFEITNVPVSGSNSACGYINTVASGVVGLINPILGLVGAVAGEVICDLL
jgi:uncharacterized membrane protein YeaQ/YmgE (transglycosylase-associated protein family)